MEEIVFLVITFYSEVQMTSGFHWCASFDEIFHMTPIMTTKLPILWWRQMAKNDLKWPFWGHLSPPQIHNFMVMMGVV